MEVVSFNFTTFLDLYNNKQRKPSKCDAPPSESFVQLANGDEVLEFIVQADDIDNDLLDQLSDSMALENVTSKHRVFTDTMWLNAMPNGKIEQLLKVKFDSSNKELYDTLHYFLSHGPVINAKNFHVVTPYFEKLSVERINNGTAFQIKCIWKYQLWLLQGLYFHTMPKTLTMLKILTEYIFVPDLTAYQTSETANWSAPTVSTFYSSITQHTNKIANDPDTKPRVIDGIHKVLLPFQSQSVDWLLAHEGVMLSSEGTLESLPTENDVTSDQISKLLDQYTPGWARVKFATSVGYEGEIWCNQISGAVITTELIKKLNLTRPPAKAFLCEEMGLGKTLEVTTLVKCHPRQNIMSEPKRDPFDRTRLVSECKTTLILCPETIISQWVDEIESSSQLSVLVYRGVMVMEDEDPEMTPLVISQLLSEYDIVLTSYNILAKELDRAIFKPTERPKRIASGRYERIDYSSPLMLLEFHRLVLDEAQLAAISMSKVAKFSRIIPRVHTWCVSGTLIRKNLHDLLSLLKSQRMFPLDLLTPKEWDAIPRNIFDRLIKDRCLRHTKQMVGTQVELPNQTRVLLRSPFSNIEWDNYSNLYARFLQQVGLNELGEPAVEGFDLDKSRIGMRKWSTWLRMVCCHALMLRASQDGMATKDDKKANADDDDLLIGTLDNVLKDLIKNTEMEIYHHDSNYLRDEITIGKIWEFIREPSKSQAIFESVISKLNLRIALFKKKIAETDKIDLDESGRNADKLIWSSRLLKTHDLLHQAYFMLASAHYQHYRPMWPLPDSFEELFDKVAEHAEIEEEAADIEKLTEEEKHHYELENEYYQKADELINHILEFPLLKTKEMISKMAMEFSKLVKYTPESLPSVPKDETAIPIAVEEDEEDENENLEVSSGPAELSELLQASAYIDSALVETLQDPKPSLGSQFVCERAIATISQLDKQSDVINNWFTRLVDLQSIQVTRADEQDATGSEYSNSLALQEESQALIDQLSLILNDRERALNSTEVEVKTLNNTAMSDGEGSDKEWIKKKKKRDGTYHTEAIKPAPKKRKLKTEDNTEHPMVYYELEKLRKFVLPEATELPKHSLKTSLLELTDERQMMENSKGTTFFSSGTLEVGVDQLKECVKSLKTELQNQNKKLKVMKLKLLSSINDTFNAKIAYYKALQSRSDELVKYQPHINTSSPRDTSLKEMRHTEVQMTKHESRVRANKARLNYLRSMSKTNDQPSEEIDQCIICRFTILVGTLTPCGHKYCRDCLKEWMKNKKICPVCKKALREDELYHFVTSKGGLKGDVVDSSKEVDVKAEQENDEDFTEEINKLKNKRMFEKDLNVVYSSMDPSTLRTIGDIELTKSYGTKVDMILRQAKYLRNVDPTTQILVFSQWNKFLNLLARAMKTEGIVYKSWTEKNLSMPGRTGRRINPFSTAGSKVKVGVARKGDNKLDRDIKEFKEDKNYACFLLNTVAQAAGLTFTNASHVFLCEPLVNLSFELQAVSRIHRIGQERETTVWNFVIEGTIEESIAYLGTKKRLMAAKMRSNEVVEIDENELEAREMTKVNEGDKREGEVIDDDDLWAAFFATKEAKILDSVYK